MLSYDKEDSAERSPSKNNDASIRKSKTIYLGKVIDNYDPKNIDRLKVRIDEIDDGIENDSLVFSYPFLSRIGENFLPKKGEIVRIIIGDIDSPTLDGNRFWVGPIISNYDKIKNEVYDLGDNVLYTDVSISKISEPKRSNEKDIFPTDDSTVTVLGRDNTDIIQEPNKIILRAGKHKKNLPNIKNNINPIYNILEYVSDELSYNLSVGDELYLISHNGKNKFKKILTKNDINDLKKNSQSLLYGEDTLNFLKIIGKNIINHIHSHPGKEAVKSQDMKELIEGLANIEKLLAKNIRIN